MPSVRRHVLGCLLASPILVVAAAHLQDAWAEGVAAPIGIITETSNSQQPKKKPRQASVAKERATRENTPKDDRKTARDEASEFSTREKIALDFAREHHPQLANLLVRMKRDDNRRAYEQAIRDVYADRERLKRFQERDSEKYALSLKIWKLDSRVRLLAARMAMSPTPEQEQELKRTLRERVDLQIELLQLDRDRAAARVERLQKTLDELQQDPEAAAQKSLDRLKRSINAPRPGRNKNQGQTPSATSTDTTQTSSATANR